MVGVMRAASPVAGRIGSRDYILENLRRAVSGPPSWIVAGGALPKDVTLSMCPIRTDRPHCRPLSLPCPTPSPMMTTRQHGELMN